MTHVMATCHASCVTRPCMLPLTTRDAGLSLGPCSALRGRSGREPVPGHRQAAGAASHLVLRAGAHAAGGLLGHRGGTSFSVTPARSPRFAGAFTLRQRMLNFVQNIQYYMMFEVMEPTWHVLEKNLKSVSSHLKCCDPDEALLTGRVFGGNVLGQGSVLVRRQLGPGRGQPGLHTRVPRGGVGVCARLCWRALAPRRSPQLSEVGPSTPAAHSGPSEASA